MTADNAIKKCTNCGNWTTFAGNYDDKCTHCGTYLEPQAVEEHNEEERKKKLPWQDPVFIVTVHPEDNILVKGGKRLIQFGQIIFMTIVSIVLWIVAALAG